MMGRSLIAALGFAFATVAVTEAEAAPKEKRRHQQVLPTGAEDAPAKASRSAAPAVDPAEALVEHSTRKDTVGLHKEFLPDGSVRVNLDDRFHSIARAVPNDDGTTQVVCGGKPETAKKAKGKGAPKAPRTAALEVK